MNHGLMKIPTTSRITKAITANITDPVMSSGFPRRARQ
jgi:hypothetical protein